MGLVALPSFLGTPEDRTKVVDAYNTTTSELRTALSEKITSFSSGLDGVFDKARGRMVGSQDYLTKPFTKDQLLQTVTVLGSAKNGVVQ